MVNVEIEKAFEEIKRLSEDPETRILAQQREIFLLDQLQREEDAKNAGREEGREEGRKEGRKEGQEEGREKGREEGKEVGRKELILKMVSKNISPEQIAELTDLPLSEILVILRK